MFVSLFCIYSTNNSLLLETLFFANLKYSFTVLTLKGNVDKSLKYLIRLATIGQLIGNSEHEDNLHQFQHAMFLASEDLRILEKEGFDIMYKGKTRRVVLGLVNGTMDWPAVKEVFVGVV